MSLLFDLPRRKPSISARWSLNVALFTPLLALLSLAAHWLGYLETPVFLVLVVLVFFLCMLALLFAVIGLRSLWVRGTRGGRRISWTLFIIVFVLAPYAAGATLYMTRPLQYDVSTDLIDPPLFQSELRPGAGNVSALVAGQLRDGYPEVVGISFNAPPDAVLDVALQLAGERGWRTERRRGRIGATPDIFVEFATRAPVIAIAADIVLRITDEGDTSFVDLRVRMPDLSHDLGFGAALARRFIADLDYAMIGIAAR